jgi:hypothetical protein
VVYLLPAVVAQVRRHYQTTAVIGLNPLLGWAFIGWAVAFAWAITATPPTVPAAPEADPPWPDAARGWALILTEAATSCTTRWDAGLQRYLTRCSDGWQFKSTYERDFQTWRTRELPPWKRLGKPKQ